jgi:hypothetical protein
MGFDIHIHCTLSICKDTGRHFYYGESQKVYDMPAVVPKEHRVFVNMKGSFFQIYANFVTDEMSTSVENFADKYPEWSDIVENSDVSEYANYWNEDTHDRFYAALKWFADQEICYMISWSY